MQYESFKNADFDLIASRGKIFKESFKERSLKNAEMHFHIYNTVHCYAVFVNPVEKRFPSWNNLL